MKFAKIVQKIDLGVVVFIAFLIFIGGFQLGSALATKESYIQNMVKDEELTQLFDFTPMMNAWARVKKEYIGYENIDYEQLSYGLAKGLIDALDDPYSNFMTPTETESFTQDLDQTLEGIGAELSVEDGIIRVVTPIKSSPAEKAGLKPGDIIFAINDESTVDMNLFEAVKKIRGPKGTYVKLTILRSGNGKKIEINIKRETIEIESVSSKIEDGIYYVSINQFSNDTALEFNKVSNEILLANPQGLILDLRYNGGGYLQTAVELLGEFLPPKTPTVLVKTGADKSTEVLKTDGQERLIDFPLVVLINEGSASASEILAGALQDYNKAFIVGAKSYGKGTVQKIEQFKDGSSLRLTIAQWLTPNKKNIEGQGIKPDLEVAITEEDIENKYDRQLEMAKRHLKNL